MAVRAMSREIHPLWRLAPRILRGGRGQPLLGDSIKAFVPQMQRSSYGKHGDKWRKKLAT